MVLSPIEIKIHSRQIGISDIGIARQELLKESEVVVLGLTHIGIAIVRTLLGSGVGSVRIIDPSIIDETMAGSQTLFGINDIGKFSCIALKEKELGLAFKDRLQLHCVQLSKQNADFVLPKKCSWVIDASCDPSYLDTLFDLADERGFTFISGATGDWQGICGVYKDRNEGVKQHIFQFFKEHKLGESCRYVGVVSFCLGGIISNMTMRMLMGLEEAKPCCFHFDGQTHNIHHEI